MSKITALTVPKWGLSMEEGTLVKWLVNEGDSIKHGDGVAELESSKIVNTLESHVTGIVYRKIAREDDTLPVGGLLAVIAEAGIADAEVDAFIKNYISESRATISGAAGNTLPARGKQPEPAGQSPSVTIDAASVPDHLRHGEDDKDVPAAPHARRLAQKLGINLRNISGSGRHGRISVSDIEAAITGAAIPAPAPGMVTGRQSAGPSIEEIPMSNTRQTIARRLQESKSTIPHYRLIADVRVDALTELRRNLADTLNRDISLNDMLIKACATALLKVPDCNVQMENNLIKKFPDADIAIAVAMDSGLLTPIIRAANRMDVGRIADTALELIDKARTGRLTMEEISGGTFTISNLGMYGIRQFDAIINPPQCAILAVGSAQPRVVVMDGQPAVATVMTLSLSLDHRVIDGATGARFLRELAQVIEQPESMQFTM